MASLPSLALAAGPAVFPVGATLKVRPQMPPQDLATAHLSAARNEFEAFQIVVQGGSAGATNVRAAMNPLTGPGGATLGPDRAVLYREDLLNVTSPSGSIGTTGQWPDPLVPTVDEIDGQARNAFPFSVAANTARAIWVDLYVPGNATPGLYKGSVLVTGDGLSVTVPVELTVWDFALPSKSSLASAFLAFTTNICNAHGVDCSTGEGATVVAKYERLALSHHITLPNVFDIRPSGTDWTNFDAIYGPLFDGSSATRLPGAAMTSAEYTWAETPDGYGTFAQHFKDRGWNGLVYDYTADEPPNGSSWSSISPRAQIAHSGDPSIKTLVTTNIDSATKAGVSSSIDRLVPIVNEMEPVASGDQRAKYDAWVAGGKQLWMYQSCASFGCGGSVPSNENWPSYVVDVSAMKNRLMQWADFKMHVAGELYYETTMAYQGNPWSSVYAFSGNGDGTLFYPGTPAHIGGTSQVPVPSIRLKMIREGMEDYEYLNLVSKLGDPAFAQSVAAEVLPTLYGAVDEPARIDAARLKLAQRILQLTGHNQSVALSPDGKPAPRGPILAGRLCSIGGSRAPLALGLFLAAAVVVRRRRRLHWPRRR